MLAKWHITITDLEGNVIPNATVYVVSEASGGMPMLYADRAGTMPLGNPTSADATGFCSFHAVGGAYAITARKGGFERTWRYVGIGTAQEYDIGALGSAVGWDDVVETQGDLPTGVAAGYRVLVIDAEDGRAAVYEWSGTRWLGPIFVTGGEGLPGRVNTLEIGTVEEGPAAATITGQSPNQVLNLTLPKGDTGDITPELEQLRQDTLEARDRAEDAAQDVEGVAVVVENLPEILAAPAAASAAQTAAASVIDALAYLDTPRSLLEALSDPLLPTPYFIESWTSRDFAGFNMRNPDGVGSLPVDSMSQPILEFTVSGSAGSQTLTISAGDESKGQGYWAAVVQHDDNTWGCYMISSLGSGTCTVWPNLRADITAKTLRNLGGSVNGQHYTEPGYRALAGRIFRATRADAYRVRYVDAWNAQTGLATDWGVVGGLGTNQRSISIANNYIHRGRALSAFISRSRRFIGSGPTSPRQGKGLTKTFALQGRSGMFEAFASRPNISNTDSSAFYPFRYVAEVDGVPFHDETYTESDGLVRIFKAFPAGNIGTITITPTTDDPAGVIHDDVTWWVYDRLAGGNDGTDVWTSRVIDTNAKTVVYGDSWTTFYETTPMQADGVLGRELQALMTAAGGSGQVIGAGQGGQTAEWGLANFDTRVAPHNPKQVLILFFTNDGNQYGDYVYDRWMTAMFKIGRKCQMIGAKPIFIMPSQTSAINQSIRHGIWASALGKGLPL